MLHSNDLRVKCKIDEYDEIIRLELYARILQKSMGDAMFNMGTIEGYRYNPNLSIVLTG